MTPPGRGYTLAVNVAKVVLPLIALGLLAALFLLARSAPQGEPLRYVEEDVRNLADSQRLGRPRYAGVTADGSELTIVADQFQPDADRDRVTHGENMTAELTTADRLVYVIRSETGTLDEVANLSTLRGDVVVTTSDGYRMLTEALEMRTDRTYLTSLSPVQAFGPPGTLEADRMEVFSEPGSGEVTRMIFTGSVRLLYTR